MALVSEQPARVPPARLRKAIQPPTEAVPKKTHTQAKKKSEALPTMKAMRDEVIASSLEYLAKKSGTSHLLHGRKSVETIIGIPFEYPVHAYLFQSKVYPLRTTMQLAGPPGGGKSSLLYDLGAFFQRWGGTFQMVEHESKIDTGWVEMFCKENYPDFVMAQAHNPAQWHSNVHHMLLGHKNSKYGDRLAMLVGVDSVTGKVNTGVGKKLGEGEDMSRSYEGAATANAHGTAIRSFADQLSELPATLVLVNHQTVPLGDAEFGAGSVSTGGGRKLKFAATLEMSVETLGKFQRAEESGLQGRITCYKNSFGEGSGHRVIPTKLWWGYEAADNEQGWKQVAGYDWDWSLTLLLLQCLNADNNHTKAVRAALKTNEIHVSTVSGDIPKDWGTVGKAKSSTLGIKEPISWTEMGAALRENEDVCRRILHAFRAFDRIAFRPEASFRSIMESVYYQLKSAKAQKAEDAEAAEEKAKADAKAKPAKKVAPEDVP